MIFTFSDTRLHNEEHYAHKTELGDILKKFPKIIEMLGLLVENYLRLYQDEDTALEYLPKSDYTAQIAEKSDERQDITRGLFHHINGDSYHFNKEIRQEAASLKNIKDHYSDISKKGLEERIAATNNLVQELNAKRKIIEKLHLYEWVDELALKNKELYELVRARNDEKASKPALMVNEVRAQIDKATAAIYEALNTFARMNPTDTELSQCIDEINVLNKRYDDRLSQRRGQQLASQKRKAARMNVPASENNQASAEPEEE